MTRTIDTRTLAEAFTLPGSEAEAVYRAALETPERLRMTPDVLDELTGVLVEGLGWDPALADAATAQVARIASVDYAPA
jgi:hypothetical protein